ncbi:MAG TPA: lipoprotein LpqH [Mycobacterium sp.]
MKREFVIAAAVVAAVVPGLSGCSSHEPSKSSSTASSAKGAGPATASVGTSATKVIIDGNDQNVQGTTVCTTVGGKVDIAIGGQATGIAAVLTDADPPEVESVGLGNVNGVTLAYNHGAGQGDAQATKDGKNYKITGTATGIDMAHPTEPVNKPFEIDVACS